MPKVVLDINVLLSGIAYPASIPGKILSAWHAGSIDLLLSAHILEELRRVLPRLAHRHGLSGAEIDALVDALAIQAEIIEPESSNNPRLRDAADEPVLDTLLAALTISEADYLITGDKDLLAVAERFPILTPAQFCSIHGGI